ncbi:MAG: hypothetical protein HY000_19580 [Planctomycetes bacterium]|nr:hypothetical protein [Planctomycetota bacterium]
MQLAQFTDLRRRVPFGRSGRLVSRLGIGSSYGVGAAGVEAAYRDHGVNYFYWGTFRRGDFGRGVRQLARQHRDDLFIVIQTYSRVAALIRPSLQRALRKLRIEYADILLLGLFNQPPRPRLLEAASRLHDEGLVRQLGVSCHRRPTFAQYIAEGVFDPLMFRYNAAHRGAEQDIFPHLVSRGSRVPDQPAWASPETAPSPLVGEGWGGGAENREGVARQGPRPGTVSYTATRWGHLVDPARMPPGEPTPRASDCYRFVLTQPAVDVCLTGPANDEQLAEAMAALERGPMDEQERAWMRRVGDHVYQQRLGGGLRNRLRKIGGTG